MFPEHRASVPGLDDVIAKVVKVVHQFASNYGLMAFFFALVNLAAEDVEDCQTCEDDQQDTRREHHRVHMVLRCGVALVAVGLHHRRDYHQHEPARQGIDTAQNGQTFEAPGFWLATQIVQLLLDRLAASPLPFLFLHRRAPKIIINCL